MEEKKPFDKAQDGEKSVEEFKKELEECQKQKDEYLAGWQRARADFINYKREEDERRKETLDYAAERFILKILPILDNFQLIKEKLPPDLAKEENIKGLIQLENQIQDLLKNYEVEEIKSLDKKFDPCLMEAVGTVELKNKDSGIIVEEVQKGYKIKDRLLRLAKVRVAK
ncbi:MAG: nucleotide exchange factor GrpE [Candidatus Pacebacteria bacterium]|nr:nucleotide exchange factor GrpE [Candidatus Paceibacterota bacterium]